MTEIEQWDHWSDLPAGAPQNEPPSRAAGPDLPVSGPAFVPPPNFGAPYDSAPTPPAFRKACSRVGLAFVLLMLFFIVGQVGVLLLLDALWPEMLSSQTWFWLCTDLPLYGLGAPVCWLTLRGLIKKLPQPEKSLRYARMNLAWAGRLFCLGELLMITGSLVSSGIMRMLEYWLGLPGQNPVADALESSSMLANLIFTVLIAAIGEELLFRELLCRALLPYGERPYLFISAGLFALFHGNLSQIPYAFLVGLLFAWLRCRTGRARWGMLLHGTINFCGGILPYLIADSVALTALWGWAIILFCVLGCVYLFRLRRPRGSSIPQPEPACGPLPPHPVRAALLNPGMIMAMLVSLALILFSILSELGQAI